MQLHRNIGMSHIKKVSREILMLTDTNILIYEYPNTEAKQKVT